MASGHKMISLTAAVVAGVLFTTSQIQAWGTAEAAGVEKDAADLVPVSPRERVLVAIPGAGGGGGVGTGTATPLCLQCWCCSTSSPRKCEVTSCCSAFNCDPAGKCNLVPLRCDCNGCGGN